MASTKRRLLSAGILTYPLAAIDGAAGGRRRSGAWPSASRAVARAAGHDQSNATGGSSSPWKGSRCSYNSNGGFRCSSIASADTTVDCSVDTANVNVFVFSPGTGTAGYNLTVERLS